MKEQSVVHIMVDYEDAISTKRNLLSSEVNFLRIIQRIKRYKLLRGEELNNRIRIQNKMRDLKLDINKMNNLFPKVKLPEILKKKEEEENQKILKKEEKVVEKVKDKKEKHEEDSIETQLREIQEKLMRLG